MHFHALEKEMATQSGVLAWRIPGTGGSPVGWCLRGHTESDTLKRLSSRSSNLKGVIWGYGAPSRGNMWKKSLCKNGVKITIISKTIKKPKKWTTLGLWIYNFEFLPPSNSDYFYLNSDSLKASYMIFMISIFFLRKIFYNTDLFFFFNFILFFNTDLFRMPEPKKSLEIMWAS